MTMIFDARTACQEIARDNNLAVAPACFKRKWKFVFLHGAASHPQAIVYRLDPATPDSMMLLFVGDDNVLFTLDKNQQLYKEGELHGYTLNRRSKEYNKYGKGLSAKALV